MFFLPFDEDFELLRDNELLFQKMSNQNLKTNSNPLFQVIHDETSKLFEFFDEKIDKFPQIFEKNLKNLDETITYLESISIPNSCKCSEIIDSVPGWKCIDCSESDSIYCSNCYIKSKNLHKGHRIYYLPKTEKTTGRCDCGDPNNLKIFCPDHKKPFNDKKEIDDFIVKSFSTNILEKLNLFFEEFFSNFSKFLILTESCTFFRWDKLLFNTKNSEQKDIALLEKNFCTIFQNFLTFLYQITNKNMGMLYLVTKFLLKNFLSENTEEKYKTSHTCAKLENKKIEILKDKESENNKHNCKCSFLRLLLTNWREKVDSKKENQNKKLLLLFTHNILIKESFSLFYFFNFEEIIFNNNDDIMDERLAFLSEDNIFLIGSQTDIIESAYNKFYDYLKEILNTPEAKSPTGESNSKITKRILEYFKIINEDLNNFIKPKMKELFNSKINIINIFLNVSCLIHNQCEYKSIYPHPEFQNKNFPINLLNLEIILVKIINKIFLCYNWKDIEKVKTFFDTLIKKILNQKSEGIKELNENEYSFHLPLYRLLGIFINYFIVNFAIKNNKSLYDGIEYIKAKLFNTKEEIEKCIDLIINDYFRMFGFITGIRNGYFNYYDYLESYNEIYFNELHFIKIDFTLLKYLIAMSDKKLSLDKMLKSSNIENTYSFFNKIFKEKNFDEKSKIEEDDKNDVLQWVRFFEIIICIMKNDSTHFWTILTSYNEIISTKTKSELFDTITNNKYLMSDLKNNLKEKLIMIFIANGNSLDMKELKKLIDEFYFKIFSKKQFDEILNELTISKIDNNKKMIYSLKDSSLKYLDINYYFSPVVKSKAELYINDFKKDIYKLFNSYYFKPSILTFDLDNKTFENILLNKENIELLIKIINILLPKIGEEVDKEKNNIFIKPIKEAFLPIILNYITMLGTINSKIFVKFKIDNKDLFTDIVNILNTALKNNKNNSIFDNDLSENVLNTINQLNKYEIINNNIKGNLNELDDYDYNVNYNSNSKDKISIVNGEPKNGENNSKKNKTNKLKEKYKNLIKQKRSSFMEKIQNDKNITNFIESDNNKKSDEVKNIDEIICLFCRNVINIDSFEEAYGKMGFIYKDYFYKNSFKSSLRNEFDKITPKDNEEKNKIFSRIKDNKKDKDISIRVLSCGHYFHLKCFQESETGYIKCPVCEKIGNILIPPLTIFYDKEKYLKPYKLKNMFIKNEELIKTNENEDDNKDEKLFKEINMLFLSSIVDTDLILENSIYFNDIVEELFLNYEYYMNYVSNIFYSESTTFFKHEQLDNIQNVILIIRYMININTIDINQVKNYIKDEIQILIKGPKDEENIFEKYKKMYYSKIIDKITFLFLVLSDYDDIKYLFVYILNWALTYFIFWIYLRDSVVKNNFYAFYDEQIKEKININDLMQYIKDNNKIINEYLKIFLQKLLMVKIISKYNNNKDNLYYNINSISIDNLFEELNMQNLYKLLPKDGNNDINIFEIFDKIPKFILSENTIIAKDFIIYDTNKIFESLISNIKKQNEGKNLVNPEFFYQFILYKFDFAKLENNLFDFIEKSLFEKCDVCKKLKKKACICLICGKKLCIEEIMHHTLKCTCSDNVFFDLQSMILFSYYNFGYFKIFDPIYTNEFNESPNLNYITNEYNLDKEKCQLALKNYISRNFH